MTNINQLSTLNEVKSGDKFPVFSVENGDTRKASVFVITEYIRQNLADALADTVTATEYVKTPPVSVANLPSAAVAGAGARSAVSDSSQTYAAGVGDVVAGGGGQTVPVFSDGNQWFIG